MTENKQNLDKTTYHFQSKGDHPNSDEVTSVPNLTSSEDNPFEKAEASKSSSARSTSKASSAKKE